MGIGMGAPAWHSYSAVILGTADWRSIMRGCRLATSQLAMGFSIYCCGEVCPLLGDCYSDQLVQCLSNAHTFRLWPVTASWRYGHAEFFAKFLHLWHSKHNVLDFDCGQPNR